jgi:ribosomal protein L11 methyltransferase
MKIKINRSAQEQLQPILNRIENRNIWYPLYNLEDQTVFKGRDREKEFYADLDRYLDFNGKTVVDLGCNLGHYSFMAARLGAARVVGLDIDENLIQAAKILRDHLGLNQVEFKRTDFLRADVGDRYDVVLLIDYIGRNVITKFKMKQVLLAAENYCRHEILLTFHPDYTIQHKLRTTPDRLISFYTDQYIRNGKFQTLEYVSDYFKGKGHLAAHSPAQEWHADNKMPVHFIRGVSDQDL